MDADGPEFCAERRAVAGNEFSARRKREIGRRRKNFDSMEIHFDFLEKLLQSLLYA
jgi:hypothetical protein